MKITVQQGSITDVECDAIIVNLFLGVTYPGGATGAVDRALGGLISRTIPKWKTSGQFGEILSLQTEGKIPAKEVIVVGLGRADQFGYEEVERVTASALHHAANDPGMNGIKKVATIIHGIGIGGLNVEKAAAAVAKAAEDVYRGYSKDGCSIWDELIIMEFSADKIDDIKRGVCGSDDQ